MTKVLADKYGLKVGESAELQFKSDMFLPVKKTLTLRSTDLTSYAESSAGIVVISEKLFKEIYKNPAPSVILAQCSSPGMAVDVIMNHSAGTIIDAKTAAQYKAEDEQSSASLMTIINFLIVFAAGMTFIGVAGNQLIGFEGRRRECAVLLSTTMTRGKLAVMFLLESFIAAGISLILAAPASLLLSALFRKILAELMITLPTQDMAGAVIVPGLLLWALFTAVAVFPISRMRKMNIAEQLKYE